MYTSFRSNWARIFVAVVILLTALLPARAVVMLGSPFTSHMVLQSGCKVPVWGTAEPGGSVTVVFAGQRKSAVADATGRWHTELDPLETSSTGREFVVVGNHQSSDETVKCEDVLVGEVWLASGQSNMDFSLSKKVKRFAGVANEEQEIAAANYPLIRMFVGTAQKSATPQDRDGGEWKVCAPENAPAFSAVGYFFARDLQREINVPVGIIAQAFGASTAEAWIDRETLVADPQLKPLVDHFDAAVESFRTNPPPVVAPPRSEDVSATNPSVGGAGATDAATNALAGRPHRASGGLRDPVQDQHNPTVLFNGMIHPVLPFAIRGVIWYQGESIVGGEAGVALYPRVQAALVQDWRRLWGQGDFPFYIVQLAGQEAPSNRPEVRAAQATILSLPNTGMAVATDIGERKNVHPKNKQDVGDRLARIALANVYGRSLEFSGPVYESMKVEADRIRLQFTHANGLTAREGVLKWFSIAGADGKYVPATATIDGQTVVVSSPEVPQPTAVRYAWVNFPDGGHLYNSAGLPAAQFRTDKSALGQP